LVTKESQAQDADVRGHAAEASGEIRCTRSTESNQGILLPTIIYWRWCI